jgi:hypothetical protein
MANPLKKIASSLASEVEKRLFAEYGSVFATAAVPPPAIIFDDAAEVDEFQSSLVLGQGVFGEHRITLQATAINALLAASDARSRAGMHLTARASDAGARSFSDTIGLWLRNVHRGLDHWEQLGRIDPERAQSIRELKPVDQIAVILDLENSQHLFFGTFFDRSILYSVAAPGASQHLSMLAFDVTEYQDPEIDRLLGDYGWYRTVPYDLPHFTYLGHQPSSLPTLGLQHVERTIGERLYGFWTPDIDRLLDI